MTHDRADLRRAADALRLAALLIVLGGFFFVFRADQHRLAAQRTENAHIARQIHADDAILATAGTLATQTRALRARLARHALDVDDTTAVAAFLREAARVAARRRTTIAAIGAAGRGRAGAGAAGFDGVPLDLTVEGRYADVLATLGELSSGRVLAAVDLSSLARKNAASNDATLSAAVHVVVGARTHDRAGSS